MSRLSISNKLYCFPSQTVRVINAGQCLCTCMHTFVVCVFVWVWKEEMEQGTVRTVSFHVAIMQTLKEHLHVSVHLALLLSEEAHSTPVEKLHNICLVQNTAWTCLLTLCSIKSIVPWKSKWFPLHKLCQVNLWTVWKEKSVKWSTGPIMLIKFCCVAVDVKWGVWPKWARRCFYLFLSKDLTTPRQVYFFVFVYSFICSDITALYIW